MCLYPSTDSHAAQAETGQEKRDLSAEGENGCGDDGADVAEELEHVLLSFHMLLNMEVTLPEPTPKASRKGQVHDLVVCFFYSWQL